MQKESSMFVQNRARCTNLSHFAHNCRKPSQAVYLLGFLTTVSPPSSKATANGRVSRADARLQARRCVCSASSGPSPRRRSCCAGRARAARPRTAAPRLGRENRARRQARGFGGEGPKMRRVSCPFKSREGGTLRKKNTPA